MGATIKSMAHKDVNNMPQSEKGWKEKLTLEQYNVMRQQGTERPFIGKYLNFKENGMYVCAACGNELFSSDTKFDSGTGWPSFSDVASSDGVELRLDDSRGMRRTEAVCKKCKSHLGHVFDDGSTSTRKRYCINSVCLELKRAKKEQ